MNNKALLVIDIQNDFTSDSARMPVNVNQCESIIFKINRLIDRASEKKMTVIYIGNEYSKFDLWNIFRNFAAIKNTQGSKLDKRLNIASNYYFPKHKGNAFSNEELGKFLKSENINDLNVCGLYAEHCVLQTLKGALKNKFQVTVLTDCIAAKTDKRLTEAVEQFKKLKIKSMSSNDI